MVRQADYLLGWLDEIGVAKAILVGHDLGGGVAQIAAVRHPERCAGLMLTNAIGYDSWPIPSVELLQRAGDVVARLPAAALRPVLASLMLRGHDDFAVALESFRMHWRCYARPDGAAALVRQARSLDVQDTLAVRGELARLRVPARVVWGAADQFQKVRYGERFAVDLGTRLVRIEGARHFTPEDPCTSCCPWGFGMGFAMLLVPLLRNIPMLVIGAIAYGVALWVLNIQILGRTVFESFTSPQGPNQLFEGLIHPLIFGLLLVPFFLGRSLQETGRSATRRTDTTADRTPPGSPDPERPTQP
ncbi:alpha/beta fold hydrolase [Actinomadura sp. 3N407]|uniref:alpha/beta fold hydrolase n=1 Tax=Actinomadura sp. 3N407 TaxID=3457423 RepID=UPI003FCCA05D